MQVQSVDHLPELALRANSAREFTRVAPELRLAFIKASPDLWTVSSDGHIIALAGVYHPYLLARPELWLLLTEDFAATRHVRALRSLVPRLRELYPNVMARCETRDSERFARLFGFRPAGEIWELP